MEEQDQNNPIQDESIKDDEKLSETTQNISDSLVSDEVAKDEKESPGIMSKEKTGVETVDESLNNEDPSKLMLQENLNNVEQDEPIDNGKSSEIIAPMHSSGVEQDQPIDDKEESSEVISQKSSSNLEKDKSVQDEEGSSEEIPMESHGNEIQDESHEEEERYQKSSEQEKSEFEKQIKYIFARPSHLEPRHPIFSSPFVRHIAVKAFGPKKPKWYTPLTSAQLYLFKDMVNFIEIGRQGIFHFDGFMEALQDLLPEITHAEVLDILENMEKDEFNELDFGKFLFLLAYKDHPDVKDEDDTETALSTSTVTPRQSLILSAVSYYVLIASPEEITRYYIANTRRKATVLHFHMEAARLGGLTEKQMEEKQKKASQRLGPLFALTGSPYACPVPFVPRTKKKKLYREYTDKKFSRPRAALPMKKKPVQRPIEPLKQSRNLGEPLVYKTKDDKTFYDMHYGRIPMPVLGIPEKIRKEMNKKCTVEHKDYITKKAYEAVAEYKKRLKEATVLYNNRSLEKILKKGFPTFAEEEDFIEVYERYMPLKLEDVKNFSLWVKPAGYESKREGKPLYPDKFAFGKKIP